jgi:hypothetical protein
MSTEVLLQDAGKALQFLTGSVSPLRTLRIKIHVRVHLLRQAL